MNNRKFINFLSYVAVILITVAIVVGFLSQKVFFWPDDVANLCYKISFYIAMIITIFSALYYASTKRNTFYMFLLILLIVAIVLFIFVL